MRERRVLVFPGGTEVGLEILAALRHCRNITILAAGEDVSSHARFAFDGYHVLPNVGEPEWHAQLRSLCDAQRIDYIFPGHDDVVVALSRHGGGLPVVVSSPPEACEITRSKTETYRHLAGIVPVPRIFTNVTDVRTFPVFVKPDRGQGSQGACKVDSPQELTAVMASTRDPVICEYLPGDEYTVDCFSTESQGLLFAGARRRRRVRNGISVNTVTENLPEAWGFAEAIGRKLRLRGAWFFQLRRSSDGVLTLLEVAPRIAGAMAVHRVAGVNFPLLSLLERDGLELTVVRNPGRIELDRCLRNRYMHAVEFETIYVDLDDTLLEKGVVNLDLVKFLFACINRHKRIVLVTRHTGDLNATLARHRLAGLFDDVIHVRDGSPKSNYIRGPFAIYVDDSFSERRDIQTTCGIMTFDSSMIEMLTEQAESLGRNQPD